MIRRIVPKTTVGRNVTLGIYEHEDGTGIDIVVPGTVESKRNEWSTAYGSHILEDWRETSAVVVQEKCTNQPRSHREASIGYGQPCTHSREITIGHGKPLSSC